MRGIILAAGRGSRMGAMTENQPKCFTELGGRSLLDWQLGAMRGSNIAQVAIVRGYLGACFDPFGSAHFDNSRFNPYNPDPEMAVTYGFDTYHEMLYGFLAYTATDEKLNVTVDPKTGHVRKK